MTMFQKQRIKDEIKRQSEYVEAGADGALDKLKASKSTAKWIGLAVIVLAVILSILGYLAV